jgi:hypothetical protein
MRSQPYLNFSELCGELAERAYLHDSNWINHFVEYLNNNLPIPLGGSINVTQTD